MVFGVVAVMVMVAVGGCWPTGSGSGYGTTWNIGTGSRTALIPAFLRHSGHAQRLPQAQHKKGKAQAAAF